MPLSLADIPDVEEDLDLTGLPSWSAKPKTATKPAPAPAPVKSTSTAKYSAQEEAATRYGAGSTPSTSTSSAKPSSRYGSGPYREEPDAPTQTYSSYSAPSKATESKTSGSSYQPKAPVSQVSEPEPEASNASFDIAPLDMDERNRIAAQIEQELTLEGLGLPDYRKGDYGTASAGKTKIVDKGVWTGSTNTTTGGPGKTRAQLLREGQEVLSVREQREAEAQMEKEQFAAAAVKMQCTYKGCTFQAVGKRGYCAAHQIEHNQRLDNVKAAAASPRSTPGSTQYQAPPKYKCSACRQPIVGQVVEALDGHWHETCFCCRGCGAEFPSGKFVNVKGQPHCRACASEAAGKAASTSGGDTCNGCRKPITTDGVEAMGASWHSRCFVCTYCGKPFIGGKFATVKGEPFCNQQCFEARLGI